MVDSEVLVTAEMAKCFNDRNDPILFQGMVVKMSRFNVEQRRILVLTGDHIYLFDKAKLNRRHRVTNMSAIIKSTKSTEVVLSFPNAKDLRLTGLKEQQVGDLKSAIQLRYINKCPEKTLQIYGVPQKSLREFSQDNRSYGFMNLPDEKYRLKDEEISGTEDTSEPVNEEEDMNQLFDQTMNQGQTGGRFSIKNNGDDEGDMDFVSEANQSMSTNQGGNGGSAAGQGKAGQHSEVYADMRKSSIMRRKRENDVKLEDFEIKMQLGKGTFGRVYLAELPNVTQKYAIKAIRKDVLIEYDQIASTALEKDILFEADHPFLCGMEYLFQSEARLYFVMPFINGGELYKIFQEQKRFAEDAVRFYAAQIIIAIGKLHEKGIMHRDLKLENIMVDETGYIKIIDYGLAKMLTSDEVAMSYCGTPEYLAPEMVNHQGHDMSVDWWAVGILIYEMLIGVTPFFNRNRQVLMSKIKHSRIVFPDRKTYRIQYSDEIVDLISGLLKKDKDQRLGSKGDAKEIMEHPFFAGIDIVKLELLQLDPPFLPGNGEGEINTKYFDSKTGQDLQESIISKGQMKIIRQKQDEFEGFGVKK